MSTMLIAGLLIATTLVTFVDAGSWKISIQEVEHVNRNNRIPRFMGTQERMQSGGNCEAGGRVYDPEESASREELNFGANMLLTEPIIFGAAEEMRNEDQGILGLANAIDPGELGSSILHEAWRQRVIDAPVFTMYLRRCPSSEDCENHGTITFGSYDREMCGEVVGHVDVNPNYSGAPGISKQDNSPPPPFCCRRFAAAY
ncbi:Peptidase A1 domain-containing protein [Aphelenchoides besseyi]|nr:Peptidase A1 domain-containing protein [Aphelenchoides besseyi]